MMGSNSLSIFSAARVNSFGTTIICINPLTDHYSRQIFELFLKEHKNRILSDKVVPSCHCGA